MSRNSRTGMSIRDVHSESDLVGLSLRVLTRYGPSDSPTGVPAGPLDDSSAGRKMVLICEDIFSGHVKIFVFLYGLWAHKLEFIKVKNLIELEGSSRLVYKHDAASHKEMRYCICISDTVEDENGLPLEQRGTTVHVRYGEAFSKSFSLTTETLSTAATPPVQLASISGVKRARENDCRPTNCEYKYHSLHDASQVPDNTRVNIYGVIVGFQQAKKCGGSHNFVSTYSLVDPSAKFHTSPVVVNMFCNQAERYPNVYKIGDVIRFHRAKKNRVSEKTVLTTYGDGADNSYILFRRCVDPISGFPVVDSALSVEHPPSPEQPQQPQIDKFGRINLVSREGQHLPLPFLKPKEWSYQSNSRQITFTPFDADTVKNLYNWGMQSLNSHSLHDLHTPLTSMGEVLQNNNGVHVTKFDMVCLVLSKPVQHDTVTVTPELKYSQSLKVWDASLTSVAAPQNDGLGVQPLLGEMEKHLGGVFSHYMGWPADFLAELHSGSFCPGSCEGDVTAGDDWGDVQRWYNERANHFLGDPKLVEQLRKDIRNNYTPIHIEDGALQKTFIEQHVRPGSWVRIRDVEVEYDSVRSQHMLCISKRTHVNILLPYFRDVFSVFSRFLEQTPGKQTTCVTELGQTEAQPASAPTAPHQRERQMLSSKGEQLSSLALCLCSPAPATFCCIVRIVDWYPKDLSLFVVNEPSPVVSSSTKHGFLFSVRVADDSATADVILFKEDAEFFLNGITADQYRMNADGVRDAVEKRLTEVVQNKIVFEFRLRLYTTLDKRDIAVKRLAAFKTSVFQ